MPVSNYIQTKVTITCDVCKSTTYSFYVLGDDITKYTPDDNLLKWNLNNFDAILMYPANFTCECPLCISLREDKLLHSSKIKERVLSKNYNSHNFWDDVMEEYNISEQKLNTIKEIMILLDLTRESLYDKLMYIDTLLAFVKECNLLDQTTHAKPIKLIIDNPPELYLKDKPIPIKLGNQEEY